MTVETYAFAVAVPVRTCSFDGEAASTLTTPPDRAKFLVLGPAKGRDSVVIQFLNWKEGNPNRALLNFTNTDETVRRYYCMPRTFIERFAERTYDTWRSSAELTAGALLLPVKLRPGKDSAGFDFSKDVTFGTAAGVRMRLSDHRAIYGSWLIGAGISSATLSPATTNKVVTQSTERAAFTWTTGLMLEVDRFQFGGFVGQDRISQPNQADWIYQGRTWLALGLGYSLLSTPPATPSKTN